LEVESGLLVSVESSETGSANRARSSFDSPNSDLNSAAHGFDFRGRTDI
jgi:hypothetical protein